MGKGLSCPYLLDHSLVDTASHRRRVNDFSDGFLDLRQFHHKLVLGILLLIPWVALLVDALDSEEWQS